MIDQLIENLLNKKTHSKEEISELKEVILKKFEDILNFCIKFGIYTFIFSSLLGLLVGYFIFK